MRYLYRKVKLAYSDGGLPSLIEKSSSAFRRALKSNEVWHIYSRSRSEGDALPETLMYRRLVIQDLVDAKYYKFLGFPEEMLNRFERGDNCYGFFSQGQLATIGWSCKNQLELDRKFIIAFPGAVGLYDFFTFPQHRSQGIYTKALRSLAGGIALEGFNAAVIAVNPSNIPSVRGILRAGFKPRTAIHRGKFLGTTSVQRFELSA